jgi:Kef-type K+ transport system membrane component KefB
MADSAIAAKVFLQLAVILLTCRAIGLLARRVGQPQVVAEMVAGFLLGRSFFEWVAPEWHAALFPAPSLRPLYVLSQIGLALYMFTVGLEFQTSLITRHARRAVSVSVAGVLAPLALGGGLALVMLQTGGLFAEGVNTFQAVLFVGAAMSITAFPVLARIIHERGIAGTAVGTLALAAGAIDDATAWIMFALVAGSLTGSVSQGFWPLAGGLVYLVVVFGLARPLILRRVADEADDRQALEPWALAVMLGLLALGAWFTDVVGIYSVFGAFTLGVAVPRGVLTRELYSTISPVTTVLLVPLYFVYSGLNARLGLLDSVWLWTITAIVFIAACVGKFLACWAAARLAGATTRDALGVGILMNARGMMELVLLNIALERGLITPTLFTMLALMAIGTTLMAYPLFGLVSPERPESELSHSPAALEH